MNHAIQMIHGMGTDTVGIPVVDDRHLLEGQEDRTVCERLIDELRSRKEIA